jgi:lipid A 3-O-deacylase
VSTRILLFVLLICLGAADVALAQRVRSWELRLDNDLLAVRGAGPPPDYDYTHGLHLAADFQGLPNALSWLRQTGREPSDAALRVQVGQRIYTPREDGAEPVPGERPYAGWLYAAAELLLLRSGTRHHLRVEVGTTGPPAMGEPVQNGFHRLVGATPQQGWDHQLRVEPALLVRYRAAWPREIAGVSLVPLAEVGLGTLWTGAAGGVDARLGAQPGRRGWHAGGGLRHERVARNLFLDGNTFRESASAEKCPGVSEAAAGFGYGFSRWEVEYRFVVRGLEYRAQPGPHSYGSLAARWHP